LRVVVSKRAGVDIEGLEHRVFHRRRRPIEDKFGLGHDLAATGAVLRPGWDAVERDDMERLRDSVVHHLQIEDGVSRGVGNAPEFALARLHLDDRGRLCWIGDGDIVERDVGWPHPGWGCRRVLVARRTAFRTGGSKSLRGLVRSQNERMIAGLPFFRLFNDILRIME
jgi:hypothetical protein